LGTVSRKLYMESIKLPIYIKATFILIVGYAFIYGLYIVQNIAVPIVFATLIAILMNPFVNFLIRKKFNKIVAISLAVLLTFVITAGLLILGIDYAIILGITGAVLNVIPYIGGVVAVALPMIVSIVTKDTISSPFLVLGLYIVVQFIDNHYVSPKIVASKVKINALVSVIVVLIGGAIWGIPGMFLSIPLTAILKVIFDNIDSLKPWGFLLGNIVPNEKKSLLVRPKKKASCH